jgi:HD-like signal output (HDOD) protein
MTSADVGEAMRERAEVLKAKLPSDLAQTIDIFLNMAMQVDALCEGLVTDIGKAALVADLYTLDELLPEGNGL